MLALLFQIARDQQTAENCEEHTHANQPSCYDTPLYCGLLPPKGAKWLGTALLYRRYEHGE
jgi:hypothetical protein